MNDRIVGVERYQSGEVVARVGRFAARSTLNQSVRKFGKVPERAATRRNFRGVFGERVKKRIDEGRFVLFYRSRGGGIRKKRKKTKWIFATTV